MSLIRRFAILVGALGALGVGLALVAGLVLSAARIGVVTEDLREELDHITIDHMRASGEAALDRFTKELGEAVAMRDRQAIQALASRLRELSGLKALRVYDQEGHFIAGSGDEAEIADAPSELLTARPGADKTRWREGEMLVSGAPICIGEACFGHVAAVMDGWKLSVRRATTESQIDAARNEFYVRAAMMTLLALIVGATIAAIVGALLGRRLGLDVAHVINALHGLVGGGYTPPELREEEMRKLGDSLDQVAEALSEARGDADEIFDYLDDGILVLADDGEILRANPAIHALAGLAEGELIGRNAAEMFGLEAGASAEELTAALASMTQMTKSDGARQPLVVSAKTHTREDEDGDRVIAMLRDGAELEAREAELSEARTRAASAEKAKSAFLAVVNHELKTPLSGIIGGADVLADGELDDTQRSFVQMIQDSGKALLGVVNDVVNYTRLDSGQATPEPVETDIDALAQGIASAVAADAAAKGLDLVVRAKPGCPPLMADRDKLIELGVQLAENAVKFTEQGQVVIDLDVEEIDGKPQLRLEVRDTGPGIAPEQRDELFNHFTQGDGDIDRAQGGVGLGLAIIKKTADLLEGRIEVDSELGEGTTFRLRLPTETAGEAPEVETPLTGQKALVVGANAAQTDAIAEKLAHGGAEVIRAATVEEAEALLEGDAGDAALIVAPEQLEGLAGSALAERMGSGEAAAGLLLRQPNAPAPEVPVVEGAQIAPAHAGAATLLAAAKQAIWPEGKEFVPGEEQDWEQPGEYQERAPQPRGPKDKAFSQDVIVADPSDVSRVVLGSFIKKAGFTCHMCSNGYEALKLFKSLRPALMIMDVTMPVMNGLEAARGARRLEAENNWAPTPILGLSATDRDTEIERCLQAGMNDTLVKPVKLRELEAKVARWTGEEEREALKQAQAAAGD